MKFHGVNVSRVGYKAGAGSACASEVCESEATPAELALSFSICNRPLLQDTVNDPEV